MPRRDTWPGGITMETMSGMDSAGSCDSVVSMNSGHSDGSLEHLSPEEKACLMFLEETIESLSTEEDSGLSNDETDHLPSTGNVADKTAHLSASIGQSKLHNVTRHTCDQPAKEEEKSSEPAYSYLVPTPLVLANISSNLLPKTRSGLEPNKENFHPRSKASFTKPRSGQCSVPSEVNVAVVPLPPKVRAPPGGPVVGLPRGPLSYEALVQLRKSASMKRAPDSPAADLSRDWNKQPSSPATPPLQGHHGSQPTMPSDPHPQKPTGSNPSPPVVAPKPRRLPSSASRSLQDVAAALPLSDSLQSERVRKEALLKLGLLRDRDSTPEPRPAGASLKSQSYRDLSAHSVLKEPGLSNPGQGQPFSYIQGSKEAVSKPRPVQSSSSLLLHRSKREEPVETPSHPLRPSRVKAATLERSGVGLGSRASEQSTPQPLSAALSSQGKAGCGPQVGPSKAPERVSVSSAAAAAAAGKPGAQKPALPVGFSVVRVPNMGEDRKQALRKLGLLKD